MPSFDPGFSGIRADLKSVASLIPSGSRVLDLGCGSGELLRRLIDKKQCTGTGVEKEPQSVLTAIGSGIPLIELDLDTQLDQFDDDSYDVVVLSRTLQAVLKPEQLLRQMARIGRRMIVSMPNFGYWHHRISLLRGRMPRSRDLPFSWYDTPNLHHSTLRDLEKLFTDLGLTIEKRIPLDARGFQVNFPIWPNLMAGSAIYALVR